MRRLQLAGGTVAAVLAAITLSRLLFPFDVGIYEANNWAPAQLLLRGENPYHLDHALRPPYTVATYGPLYYLLVGLGLQAFGIQLWFGRLLAIAGAGAALWGVFRLAEGLSERRGAGWLAATALAAQFPLQFWSAAQRPDLVALGFSVAGLVVALDAARRERASPLRVAATALLFAAAFHCRQTSLLAALLAGAWLTIGGGWRRGALFATLFFLGCFLPACLLELTSDGGYSAQLWRMPSTLPRRADVLATQLLALAQGPQFWVLLIAFPAALRWLWTAAPAAAGEARDHRLRMALAAYTLASLGAALVTSSIPGSNVNYYLEACAALALCLPLAIPAGGDRSLRLTTAALVCGALLTGVRVGRGEWYRWRSLPYLQAVVARIESLTTVSEPVYADYPELVTAAGRTYYLNTIVPYDGRSPRLAGIPDAVFDTGAVRLVVDQSPNSHPDFVRIDLPLPMPAGVYPIYLHVHRDLLERTGNER